MPISTLLCWDFVYLSLDGSHSCWQHCYRFIGARSQEPGGLYFPMAMYFLPSSYNLSAPSSLIVPETPGQIKFNIGVLSKDPQSAISYTLWFGHLWSFMFLTLCCMRELHWWELKDALLFSLPLVSLCSMILRCRGSIVDVWRQNILQTEDLE